MTDGPARLTWYGHSCVELLTPGGTTVLIDPWFANPSSPRAADSVDRCDVMLVTHGHFDHLGDALAIAARTHPAWPAIHELSLWLATVHDRPDDIVGMNKGGTVATHGLRITMVPADHSAGNWDPAAGTPLHLGEPVGVVIELEDGRRLYHSGDTALFSDLRLVGERYRPEIAMLPIGGHYTMDPPDAAIAVELLGVRQVLPLHCGTFPILAGTPSELRSALRDRGLADVVVHEPVAGDSITV